ncbi:MAG: IS66 family insertion sequence element accessory protein TnpB [Methylococcaceae bacterium]|jgi:transposase
MIHPEQVHLAVEPVDMRWGSERLSVYIQHTIGQNPCAGHAYAFTNRQRSRLKLLLWDVNGIWLCQRRLHRGVFKWPETGDTTCTLRQDAWQWLVSGIEWQRLASSVPAHGLV